MGKFEYWKSQINKQWYWRLKARNGRVICQSEGYKSKAGCLNGIGSVITHVRDDFQFSRRCVGVEQTNE